MYFKRKKKYISANQQFSKVHKQYKGNDPMNGVVINQSNLDQLFNNTHYKGVTNLVTLCCLNLLYLFNLLVSYYFVILHVATVPGNTVKCEHFKALLN